MTATAHRAAPSSPVTTTGWPLVAVEVVIAVNAVGGAVWDLAGAENVPPEWLEGGGAGGGTHMSVDVAA